MSSTQAPQYQLPLWQMMITGGLAGSWAEILTIPIDSAQVRLQIQAEGNKVYSGLIDCLKKMFVNEGFAAPFAGLSAGLQRQMVFASLRIGLYEPVRDWVCGKDFKGDPPLLKKILAALITGAIGITVASPTDLVKIRFQGDRRLPASERRYTGVFNAYSQIVKQQGVVGLWTGLLPNIARNAVFNAAELASFDQYKEWLLKTSFFVDNIYCHLAASSGAGFTAAVLGSPVDVVKTRIMNAQKGTGKTYTGVLDCITRTFTEEGFLAFYKGFGANASRIVSWNVVMFVTLGQIRNYIGQKYYRIE